MDDQRSTERTYQRPRSGERAAATLSAVSLAAILAGCGSNEAPEQVTVTETVAATPDQETTTTPPEKSESTPTSPTTEPGQETSLTYSEEIKLVKTPAELVPVVNTLENLTYDEKSDEFKRLESEYPKLIEGLRVHNRELEQLTFESVRDKQKEVKAIMESTMLIVDENGELQEVDMQDFNSPTDGNLLFQEQLGIFNPESDLMARAKAGEPGIGALIGANIVTANTNSADLRNVHGQAVRVEEYFAQHPEEYGERINDDLLVKSEASLEDFVNLSFINGSSPKATIENVYNRMDKIINDPGYGGSPDSAHPVEFSKVDVLAPNGGTVEVDAITLLAEYPNGEAELKTIVLVPHEEGYFTNKYDPSTGGFSKELVKAPQFNPAQIANTRLN